MKLVLDRAGHRCIRQVTVVGKTVFNIFLEPQFTILHSGTGQPAFQLYTALNMQFKSN